jgi:dihydrofolate reductase
MKPKTILYIAMSEDGFIAGDNNNLDFLNPYQSGAEDYGYYDFIQSVGSILVGRKTYDKVLDMGYPYHEDKLVYVISRTTKTTSKFLKFYGGDLKALIDKLKNSDAGNIYCDGGAKLAHTLIKLRLIDEMIISVVPVYLKSGTLLFDKGNIPEQFQFIQRKEYNSGLIQSRYQLKD